MSAEEIPVTVEIVSDSVPVSSPAPAPPVVVEPEDDTYLSRHEWEMLLQSCSAEKSGFISARQLWEKLGHFKTKALKQKLEKEREVRNLKRQNNVSQKVDGAKPVNPVNPKREMYARQKKMKLAKKKTK